MIEIMHCTLADKDHERSKRQYAHTFHRKQTVICVCKDWYELPAEIRDAITLHEIGHLIAGPHGGEQSANNMVKKFFDIDIRYGNSRYGKDLERLDAGDHARARQLFKSMNLEAGI